jgi:hypothetical protein
VVATPMMVQPLRRLTKSCSTVDNLFCYADRSCLTGLEFWYKPSGLHCLMTLCNEIPKWGLKIHLYLGDYFALLVNTQSISIHKISSSS